MSISRAGLKKWMATGHLFVITGKGTVVTTGEAVHTREWDQKCQALMWQITAGFGKAPKVYPTANAARLASKIVSKNYKAAKAGAFHFWEIGTAGHVALQVDDDGTILMASKHIKISWAKDAGLTTVEAYSKASGAKYIGWANTLGANDVEIVNPAPKPTVTTPPISKPSKPSKPAKLQTKASSTGKRDGAYWKLLRTTSNAKKIHSKVTVASLPNTKLENMVMGYYYNSLKLKSQGKVISSEAVKTGVIYNGNAKKFSNFVLMGQIQGHNNKTYSGPINGIDGINSKISRIKTLAIWLNKQA